MIETIRVLKDNVALRAFPKNAMSKGGIILPGRPECAKCVVNAVGADVVGLQSGDIVLIPLNAGYVVPINGEPVIIAKADNVIVVLTEHPG